MALAALFCMAMAAKAQSPRILDLRPPPATSPPAASTLKPGEPCNACGRIVSIREVPVEHRRDAPSAFQAGGASSPSGAGERSLPVGAVINLPLGGETAERPFVGGVGTPEMRERFAETTYEITVRLDDGATRFIQRKDGGRYEVGDRVRIRGPAGLEPIVE
jgi:outer membrane lipoprotein SlyB